MTDLENLTAENLTLEEIKKLQEVLATAEKKKMEETTKRLAKTPSTR